MTNKQMNPYHFVHLLFSALKLKIVYVSSLVYQFDQQFAVNLITFQGVGCSMHHFNTLPPRWLLLLAVDHDCLVASWLYLSLDIGQWHQSGSERGQDSGRAGGLTHKKHLLTPILHLNKSNQQVDIEELVP